MPSRCRRPSVQRSLVLGARESLRRRLLPCLLLASLLVLRFLGGRRLVAFVFAFLAGWCLVGFSHRRSLHSAGLLWSAELLDRRGRGERGRPLVPVAPASARVRGDATADSRCRRSRADRCARTGVSRTRTWGVCLHRRHRRNRHRRCVALAHPTPNTNVIPREPNLARPARPSGVTRWFRLYLFGGTFFTWSAFAEAWTCPAQRISESAPLDPATGCRSIVTGMGGR